MIRGKELEKQAYELAHVQQVLAEIEGNFPHYFNSFIQQPLEPEFEVSIREYEKEQDVYRDYLHLDALEEFQDDPNAFKQHTRKRCPIIRRCLMSHDEAMKAYKRSFQTVTGRQLLDPIRLIANFGKDYVTGFDNKVHEASVTFQDLGLEILNEAAYGCIGVVGYGIQSSLLYGIYPGAFAHRSQNAVWSLYFLSGRKDFGLEDGSEFLMVQANQGTCEQNYFYPAELFGFYSLKVYLLLKSACVDKGVLLNDTYRYVYLSKFCDHVGEVHRNDINVYKWSSEHVESRPWF